MEGHGGEGYRPPPIRGAPRRDSRGLLASGYSVKSEREPYTTDTPSKSGGFGSPIMSKMLGITSTTEKPLRENSRPCT